MGLEGSRAIPHGHVASKKTPQWKVIGTRQNGSTQWQATWAGISKGIVDMEHRSSRALRQIGYDGWLSFEDFSTDVPLAQRLRDNIKYIRGVAETI